MRQQHWLVGALGFVLAAAALNAQGAGPVKAERGGLAAGDAANGRALVEANRCLDCHRIGERGSRLGPDLSEIGTLRTPEQLQRAIVAPDADVLPQHRFVRVVTRNGAEVSGRLLNQDAFTIQLISADEQLRSFLKGDLREHTIVKTGLMPSFERKLTTSQIADIVSYLESLKGAQK